MFQNLRASMIAAAIAVALGWGAPAAIIYLLDHPRPSDAGTLAALVHVACAPDRKVTDAELATALTCQDLAAQASMGRSTGGLYLLGWVQLLVSVVGTAFLLISLRETRKATKLTQKAVESQVEATKLTRDAFDHQVKALEHQQQIDKATLRARIGSSCIPIEATDKTPFKLRMEFENVGLTSAQPIRACYLIKVIEGKSVESQLEDLDRTFRAPAVLQKGKTVHFTKAFSAVETSGFVDGTKSVHLAMFAVYEDEFGGRYQVSRRERRTGPTLMRTERLKNCAKPPELAGLSN